MKYALGIDLGGTFIKYAVVSDDGVVLYEGKCPTKAVRNELLGQLREIVGNCIDGAAHKGVRLEGVGIGTPGIIDPTEKILLGGAPNIADWEDVPIAEEIEKQYGIPVRLCNDANAMGLAEYAFGAARGFSDVVFISVGTGIGGAVIVDNKMLTGYQNRGAELGCIPLNVEDGVKCACGTVGCWEAYASTAAMLRFYKDRTGEEISGKELMRRYHAGEDAAKEIFDKECYYLGRGIAGLINIFAPQRVVIGGGISESGGFFAEMVSRVAMDSALHDCAVNTEICLAEMGNQAGVVGAASLMFGRG